jgi:hypothetical protein
MVNLISDFGLRKGSSFYRDFTSAAFIPKKAPKRLHGDCSRPILWEYYSFQFD